MRALVRKDGVPLRTIVVRRACSGWEVPALARGEVAYLLGDDGLLIEPPVVFTGNSDYEARP
jgi:hypothetical protein